MLTRAPINEEERHVLGQLGHIGLFLFLVCLFTIYSDCTLVTCVYRVLSFVSSSCCLVRSFY